MPTRTWRILVVAELMAFAGAIAVHLACKPPRPCPPSSVLVEASEYSGPATRRLVAKKRATLAVIAGRLSLLEAASLFKSLDADGPPCSGWVFPMHQPGVSDEEYYCRMVIVWVSNEAPRDQADDLVCMLQAELDARLAGGPLRLPELDDRDGLLELDDFARPEDW